MSRWGYVIQSALLAGCGAASSGSPTSWEPSGGQLDGAAITAPAADTSLLQDDDKEPVLAAHAATATTVTSQQFVDALSKLDNLYDRVDGTPMHGRDVARAYFGRNPEAQRLPLRYANGGMSFLETAHTVTREARPVRGGATIPAFGLITLRDATIVRATGDTEHLACAVNTLAHEWTHLVSRTGEESVFQDEGHKHAQGRLVSYTVGAVAQCVFLAEHGYPDLDIDACVDEIGTHVFDKKTCTRAGVLTLRTRPTEHRS